MNISTNMFRFLKKNIAKHFGGKQTKIEPISNQYNSNGPHKPVNYMDMLEQFWIEKPNNFQGAIVYETTFVQGGYTSFVTLPTGHCFANPKRCRTAHNSRQLAARVALFHSMFGGNIFHDNSTTSLDSTLEEIAQNYSVSNIKCDDKEDSMETIRHVLSHSWDRLGSEQFEMLLKLKLMHWNGSFAKLANMRYTKKQIARELSYLSVDHLKDFMTLEWATREEKQPGVIKFELARCQSQLFKATRRQQNVRVPKEKCLILVAALDMK